MFSRTTIASSIRMPIASDRPSSDIVFSVKPNAQHRDERGDHRDRQREAGDHRRSPRVQEQEHDQHGQHRALEQRLLRRSRTDASTRMPASRTMRKVTPSRQRPLDLGDLLANHVRDLRGAVALRLLDVDADRLFAVEQRRRARLLRAILHVGDVAEPHDPALRCADRSARELGRLLEPAAQPDRALVELAVEPADRRREVLRLERLDDLRDAEAGCLQVASAGARPSARARRRRRPRTSATPGMPRSSRVMPADRPAASAPARVSRLDDSASDTIGKSAGSNRVRIGSSISGGRSLRISEILSRISWVASCRSFSNWKNVMMTP